MRIHGRHFLFCVCFSLLLRTHNGYGVKCDVGLLLVPYSLSILPTPPPSEKIGAKNRAAAEWRISRSRKINKYINTKLAHTHTHKPAHKPTCRLKGSSTIEHFKLFACIADKFTIFCMCGRMHWSFSFLLGSSSNTHTHTMISIKIYGCVR